MADITFECSECKQPLVVDAGGAGQQVQCPTCSQSIKVPQPFAQSSVLHFAKFTITRRRVIGAGAILVLCMAGWYWGVHMPRLTKDAQAVEEQEAAEQNRIAQERIASDKRVAAIEEQRREEDRARGVAAANRILQTENNSDTRMESAQSDTGSQSNGYSDPTQESLSGLEALIEQKANELNTRPSVLSDEDYYQTCDQYNQVTNPFWRNWSPDAKDRYLKKAAQLLRDHFGPAPGP